MGTNDKSNKQTDVIPVWSAMKISSLLFLVRWSVTRKIPRSLTFLMTRYRSVRRIDKRRLPQMTTVPQPCWYRKVGLKEPRRYWYTWSVGKRWMDSFKMRDDNSNGVKKKTKNHLLWFKGRKNRKEHEPINDKLPSQPPLSLQPLPMEEMCRPEQVIDDQHQREASLQHLFRNGRSQNHRRTWMDWSLSLLSGNLRRSTLFVD